MSKTSTSRKLQAAPAATTLGSQRRPLAGAVPAKHNELMFKVLRDATKPEIKAAIELMFKVEVQAVSLAHSKGKTKRFGSSIGGRRRVLAPAVRSQRVEQDDLDAAVWSVA